jgi:hypothetical protein
MVFNEKLVNEVNCRRPEIELSVFITIWPIHICICDQVKQISLVLCDEGLHPNQQLIATKLTIDNLTELSRGSTNHEGTNALFSEPFQVLNKKSEVTDFLHMYE